jgi:hypothetical protein
MIVGSLLLILVAVGLLVAGVLSGSNILIVLSIVATVIAAVVLILGVRQSAADDDEYDADEAADQAATGGARSRRDSREQASRDASRQGERVKSRQSRSSASSGADEAASAERDTTTVAGRAVDSRGTVPAQTREGRDSVQTPADEATGSAAGMDDDPPGEPPVQTTSPANVARIALLTTEVLVVDGRPRYHLAGCVHLLGRESEPLPVGEALELGFTPCGMCEPDSDLVAEARSV